MVHVNRLGLALFGAESVEEMRARQVGAQMTPAAILEVSQVLQEAIDNGCISRQWTIYPAGKPVVLNVIVGCVWLRPDHPALVVTAAPDPNADAKHARTAMLRHTPAPVLMIDTEAKVRHMNPAAKAWLGDMEPKALIPAPIWQELTALAQEGGRREWSVVEPAVEGVRPFHLVAARTLEANDGAHAVVLCALDIGDLVHTQRELSLIKDRLEDEVLERTADLAAERDVLSVILDSVQAAVGLVAADGTIKEANDLVLRRCPDAVGRPAKEVFGFEVDGLVDYAEPFERTEIEPDGTARTFEWSARRLGSGSGELLLTGHELTERLLLERQLRENRAFESLGRLAGAVAHDLNNPLTYVVANASLLVGMLDDEEEEGLDIEEMKLLARDCLEGAKRAGAVVRQLKATVGAPAEGLEAVEVAPIIQRAVRHTAHRCPDGVRVRLDFAPNLWVRATTERLEQVLINLMENAFDALEGTQGEVFISAAPSDGRVVFCVQDNGPGMPPETLRRAFDAFYSTKAPGKGTGLGLAICQQLVRAFGGTINLESSPQIGTRVRIILHRTDCPKAIALPKETVPVPTGRLLFVDDEEGLHRAMVHLLPEMEVLMATSGQAALQILNQVSDVDVILSDLMMPNGDGRWLFAALKSHHPDLVERVIFTSGGALYETLERFVASSERPYLNKPFEPVELRQQISKLMATTLA